MADLDSFFAKKDKKKKGKGKKFSGTSPAEMAKALEVSYYSTAVCESVCGGETPGRRQNWKCLAPLPFFPPPLLPLQLECCT